MTNLESISFVIHLLVSIMIMCVYIITMVTSKDELEEKAQSDALMKSNLLTIVSIIAYVLYKAVIGNMEFTVHTILTFTNILCVLYLFFYFLYIKGIRISFKIRNIKILNTVCYLSTAISSILIVLGIFKVKLFELPSSFIRLDTLVVIINIIIVSLMIGLYPNKKVNRQEYKDLQKTSNKLSKIVYIVYGFFILALVVYCIYRFYIK
ncbi:hypothetical protein ACER0A_013850 [Haloimpatiens sp. FM7315]|uniref:hypothetical protein n=1 Tax=Haloimpatiens sp. FM7315 TaxID=3298609 RepID=UPI0035A291DD